MAKLFIDDSQQTRTDLELGIEILQSGAPRPGAAPSDTQDAARAFQSQFHMNFARFNAELPVLDSLGADAADKAVNGKAAIALLSLRTADAVAVTRDDWQEYADAVGRATSASGWTASMVRSLGTAAYAGGDQDARARSAADLEKKYYIAVYMQAYFRNGEIFELKFDDQNLKTALMNRVKQSISDKNLLDDLSSEIDTATGAFKKDLCKQDGGEKADCSILGVLGQQTFVTRAGKSYGFPGVTAALDPVGAHKVSTNKIKWNDIAGDLVRVSVEAAGDSLAGVPGVANSTICREMNKCVDPKNSDEVKLIEDRSGHEHFDSNCGPWGMVLLAQQRGRGRVHFDRSLRSRPKSSRGGGVEERQRPLRQRCATPGHHRHSAIAIAITCSALEPCDFTLTGTLEIDQAI
jgi:hypothetical protein